MRRTGKLEHPLKLKKTGVTLSELTFFNGLVFGWFVLAAGVFLSLLFFAAPYGRYVHRGWGLAVNNRLGWVIMESAAPLAFAVCFFIGS